MFSASGGYIGNDLAVRPGEGSRPIDQQKECSHPNPQPTNQANITTDSEGVASVKPQLIHALVAP